VAEVLQSAEAMKAAVNHLEQFMQKADAAARGKIVLATVKGDVHDIGKNLVEIILSNNGYTVINVGIKVASEALIQAYRAHRPDAMGLSGLLVKSAAADGDYRGGLQERRQSSSIARRWRRAVGEVHDDENRASLRRSDVLCQGRHDRPAAVERDYGSGHARGEASQSYVRRSRRASKRAGPRKQ